MSNPADVGFRVGFGLLTAGIDAKVRGKGVTKGASVDPDDAALRLRLLQAIAGFPGIPLSALEAEVGDDDVRRRAVLPNRLAQAQRDGLVTVDSLNAADPRWTITEPGKTRLDQLSAAS